MADCIYNLQWHTRCATDQKKKLFKSDQIYKKDAHYSENEILVNEFFLCDF